MAGLVQSATLEVLDEVGMERDRQDGKWGTQDHHPAIYFNILAEEVGETAKEVVDYTHAKDVQTQADRLRDMRTELIQTAAVAVAMVEAIDRGLWEDLAR